ncbi:hypothetical protein BT93_I0646 [Corymbia citriodora subsp. variegata]|nr:hypothetical protein BT93_I0646 [Corymbia citriodora subsp. variegata]
MPRNRRISRLASKQAGATLLLSQPRHDCIDMTFAITNKVQALSYVSKARTSRSEAPAKSWHFGSVLDMQVRSFCKT